MTPLGKESIIDHLLLRIVHSDNYNFRYYLRECLLRLPIEDLKAIAYERNIHLINSTGNTVLHLDPIIYDPGIGDRVLAVFVINFSRYQPHEILYTIAHEFAHVFLGHYDRAKWKGGESELQADRQVIAWGFENELRRCDSCYLRAGE
jgi:hypothetical protein